MGMDFRITNDYSFEMGALLPRDLLTVIKVFLIINQALASPVWMPQFLSGGQGRNIRHLPCVSRRTGEQGICMFAYTCMKSNGTHLGTCIDRFYFGSCCKLKDSGNDLLLEHPINFPVINNNRVSSPYYPDESKIQNLQTTSLQNLFNTKFTVSSADNYYPYKSSTPKVETTTQFGSSHYGPSTDKTVVDLAQHLATETYFLTPSTEKIYVPIYSSVKPNKTEILSSSSGLFSTLGSSSSGFNDLKKPTTQNPSFFESTDKTSTSTQSYFLSTFQIVHNEDGNAPNKTSPSTPVKLTTVKPVSEVVTSWTPVKIGVTTPAPKKNVTVSLTSKPPSSTVTKKPVKPNKPATTTRKPPSKKPTPKPVVKPVSTSQTSKPTAPVKKPVQAITTTKSTTVKPSTPTKKPSQPTKKPPTFPTKVTTAKPPTTYRPIVLSTKHNSTSSSKPIKPSSSGTTTTSVPYFTTIIETTSEVIFTKPGIASNTFSTPQTNFGITTFRPDLTPTTKKPALVTGPHLTTFNYVSEGLKVTTPRPTIDGGHFSTISNEIPSSSLSGVGSIPEAQEENTNIIFQQAGSTSYPDAFSQLTSSKPNDTTIPFFPEASKPGLTNPPWIQIVQSTSSEATVSTTPKSTSTTNRPYTSFPIFSGLNTSDYTQVCGRRIFPESRVVGGEKSTFGKWPWQISLRQWRTSTYLHKCGAALLNENWAITAAHCVENVPPSDLLLRLGEHDLSTEDEPYGFQERRVQIVASHPQFDPRTFEYDLALLRFYEPVKFQPNIIPVCVPEDSTNFVGQTAYVTGWGRLYEDGPLPSILQEVSVPVINNTLCENMYRSAGYIEHIPEIFICAGWKKGGFDSCEGDSGGPMVIQRPDKRWLLAGVISWGIGCAEPNQPGVYTRISEFREWIHQILQF